MTITKMYQIIMIFLLTIEHCLAKSANSQQPTANSQQPTANSQQPTANSQQPTANSQQPTANSQQPTANSQQPTANSQLNLNQNNILYSNNVFNKSEWSRIFPTALFLCLTGQFVMLNLFQHLYLMLNIDPETSSG